MKEIPLRNKNKEIVKYAQVDDEDFEKVNQYKWHLKDGKYAMGWIK